MGKGKLSPKVLSSGGKVNKGGQKGKGKKEKAQSSANVLDISGLPDLSITSCKSIDFSCYEMSDRVEWYLDSGCSDYIMPDNSNFTQYRKPEYTEITDRKYLTIVGYGTIVGHSIMPDSRASLQIQQVLFILEVNKQLYLSMPWVNIIA